MTQQRALRRRAAAALRTAYARQRTLATAARHTTAQHRGPAAARRILRLRTQALQAWQEAARLHRRIRDREAVKVSNWYGYMLCQGLVLDGDEHPVCLNAWHAVIATARQGVYLTSILTKVSWKDVVVKGNTR